MDPIPLIIYFEGEPQAGDTIYSYTTEASLRIIGYRVLSREGLSQDFELRKNGALLDTIEAVGTDFKEDNIPSISFDPSDTLTITIPNTPLSPLGGVTIIFNCEVEDAVEDSASLKLKRIQTPLVARYEGILAQDDIFFYFVPTQRMEVFRYSISLRNPANEDVILNLRKNGRTATQITLPANQLFQEGLIDVYYEIGEEITLEIAQTGSDPDFGESLLLLLDYRNTNQTEFADFQTPFIVEYEGLDVAESNSVLRYHWPRDVVLSNLQLFLRGAISEDLLIGVYKNGQSVTSFSLVAGNVQTPPTLINLSFVAGDYLEVAVIRPTSLSSGLLLTIDYEIKAANRTESFHYYSDPASDIVMLARQVGFGGAKADAISFKNLDKYQRDVDNILNGRLRALYRTPLAKVSTGDNPWPSAIQAIAQRLVLRYLLNDIYSEVEPNASINVQNQANLAQEDLNLVLRKEIVLEGQRLRARNGGSNPYTEPLSLPASETPQPIAP